MEFLLFLTILLSFIVTLILLKPWIKIAFRKGLLGKDMQKKDKRKVAEGGGVPVLAGFTIGVLFYIGVRTFVFKTSDGQETSLFAMLSVLFIGSIVGIMDDLLGWKKGLSKRIRIIIILVSAIPLMVINAGVSTIGGVDIGIFYPLIFIPLGILGATTTFNFLAGYNGLEAGQGILILGALAIVMFITGNAWLSVISLCMVASLIAFYIFNKYPAKVFPGDILTYSTGALIAIIAILGNAEKIAVFFFIPYLLETVLKLRGKLKKESFAKLDKDGNLEMPYKKIYGLEHLAIYILKKIKPSGIVSETEVVYAIFAFQILIIILGFLFVL